MKQDNPQDHKHSHYEPDLPVILALIALLFAVISNICTNNDVRDNKHAIQDLRCEIAADKDACFKALAEERR